MPQPSLDIVLPCYNPPEGWTQAVIHSLSKICNALSETKVRLVIVNDGSTNDITPGFELLKERFPIIAVEAYRDNKGKGYAVRRGVALAESDVVVYTDIDFPYEEAGLLAIYKALSGNQCDVALGIRDDDYYRNVPASRRMISRFLKQLIRLTLNVPTTDTQAGLKGFNKKGREVFLKTSINRYLFDLEFIWLAAREKGLRIQLVPLQVKEGLHFSAMNWKILFTEAFNFMRILFRLR